MGLTNSIIVAIGGFLNAIIDRLFSEMFDRVTIIIWIEFDWRLAFVSVVVAVEISWNSERINLMNFNCVTSRWNGEGQGRGGREGVKGSQVTQSRVGFHKRLIHSAVFPV